MFETEVVVRVCVCVLMRANITRARLDSSLLELSKQKMDLGLLGGTVLYEEEELLVTICSGSSIYEYKRGSA